ncbi:hypothetical protein JCM14713_09470 [Desulfomicrobium salsuginis]
MIPGVEMIFSSVVKREWTDKFDKIKLIRKVLSRFNLRPGATLESASLYWFAVLRPRKHVFDVVVPVGGEWTFALARKYFPDAKVISWGQAGPVESELLLSDAFIAVTEVDAQRAALLTDKPIFCIPNGVDVDVFTVQTGQPPIPTILCCAALTDFKRLDLLLDAAGLLDRSVRIVLAGQGPQEASLRKHPTCQTHWVEFVSRPWNEMPALYKDATIFSLPSPEETFGIVFLEALATGLNVVAHDSLAQRFVLGDRGYYADVYDAKAYAEQLNNALKARDVMANRARAELFSWQQVAERFVSVVAQLTNSCSGILK